MSATFSGGFHVIRGSMFALAVVLGTGCLGRTDLPESSPAAQVPSLPETSPAADLGAPLALAPGQATQTTRPAKWAKPVSVAGAANLHKVSDHLYRSAQPTAEGMQNLKKMGIKTIVNLRSSHSDQDILAETGLAYESIPMRTWSSQDDDIVRFLRIVNDPEKTPVLVHCQYGSDRTGTVCAVYRIAAEGWSKQEAVKEMTEGGFGFHQVWSNLVRYVNELDIEKIKQKARAR